MGRLSHIVLALCLVLLLAACAPKEAGMAQSGGASAGQAGAASSIQSPEADGSDRSPEGEDLPSPALPPVTADYAQEELLEREGDYDYFQADEGEWQVKLAFTARERVTDLQYVELNLDFYDQEGELCYGVGEVFYTQEELTPQRPLVVGMVFYGDVANRGLTYVDGQGEAHCVSINMSGEDGSILLVEEELAPPEVA